jgi:hypothetical protein
MQSRNQLQGRYTGAFRGHHTRDHFKTGRHLRSVSTFNANHTQRKQWMMIMRNLKSKPPVVDPIPF